MNPLLRLDRHITGQGLAAQGERSTQILSRDQPPAPTPVQKRVETMLEGKGRSFTVRMTRRTANAGPNAPKLIRLVRHPYALDRGYHVRGEGRPGLSSRPERQPHGSPLRGGATADLQRPHPTQRPRLQTPDRPSADGWLEAKDG